MSKYMKLFEAIGGDVIGGCQPFVFTPAGDDVGEIPPPPAGEILAAPFPVFCYEVEYNFLTVQKGSSGRDDTYSIAVVMVEEIDPDLYRFTLLMGGGHTLTIVDADDAYRDVYNLTAIYLNRLRTEKRGEYSGVGRVKYRDGNNNKCIYKPRNIIYISGGHAASRTLGGTNVRHLNSWSVMGHWRRLKCSESLGKNRTGEREVRGYTWIKTYDKGDGSVCVRRIA